MYHLGWKRDLPDHRDFLYSAPSDILRTLPSKVDLRSTMPPVYDQGQIGCHDERTEVLTDNGWKFWSALDGTEQLGTMRPLDHTLEFQAPSALHTYAYDGPMHYAEHKSLDFAMTPTHRMYVRKWNEKARTLSPDFDFTTIENIGRYTGLPNATSGHLGVELQSIKLGNREWNGNDFLALIALVVSDGSTGSTEHNWNRVSFCCFREDRLPMVRDLAARLQLPEVPGRPGVWTWHDPDLAAWLRSNAYTGQRLASPFKRIPDIVKATASNQIATFFNYYGDQHCNETGQRQFYTSSQKLAGDIQELLLRVGKRGRLYERAPRDTTMNDGRRIEAANGVADITIVERETDRLSIERRKNIRKEHYKGGVFCATVPNGLLVTRRNGSMLISGNSCTANSIAGAIQFDRLKLKEAPDFIPSRLFIYFQERSMENTVALDAGAAIRDGIKSIATLGVCPETDWPYLATPADPATNLFPPGSPPVTRPSAKSYTDALQHTAISYARVQQSYSQLRGCLAQGYPFVFGFSVYSNIYDANGDPVIDLTMPSSQDQMLGGHAVLCCGYSDATRMFTVRNSWGSAVQDKGYFYIPYGYLTDENLASDFWTIRKESA